MGSRPGSNPRRWGWTRVRIPQQVFQGWLSILLKSGTLSDLVPFDTVSQCWLMAIDHDCIAVGLSFESPSMCKSLPVLYPAQKVQCSLVLFNHIQHVTLVGGIVDSRESMSAPLLQLIKVWTPVYTASHPVLWFFYIGLQLEWLASWMQLWPPKTISFVNLASCWWSSEW